MIDVRSRGIADSKGTNLLNAIHVQIQDTPEAAEKDEKEDKEDKDDKQDKENKEKEKELRDAFERSKLNQATLVFISTWQNDTWWFWPYMIWLQFNLLSSIH